MKKYITTDKHPELKEGIILHGNGSSYCIHQAKGSSSLYAEYHIEKGLEKGHIKELQEPEFTKDDMIDFCYKYSSGDGINSVDVKTAFNEWLNQRDK